MRVIDYAWTRPFDNICRLLPPAATIVEVGTINAVTDEQRLSQGWSSLAWAAHVNRTGGILHTIDISAAHIEACKTVLSEHLPQPNIDEFVRFHIGDGAETLARLAPTLNRIDLLYIDGGTGSEPAVRQLEVASAALDRGLGLVAFDDADAGHPDINNPECRAYLVFHDPAAYGLEPVFAERACMVYQRRAPGTAAADRPRLAEHQSAQHDCFPTDAEPSKLWVSTTEAFEKFVAVRDKSVLDVGANEGGFTDLFLHKGASRVVAIEPGPGLAAGLRRRFAADPRVVVAQEGVSDRRGELKGVKFHNCWTLAKPGEFANRLSAVSPGAEAYEGGGVFDVQLTTIDDVVREQGLADLAFIKIDVDGYEARALRGAEHTLRRLRPAVMIELSYLIHDLGDSVPAFIDHIYTLGYVVTTMAGDVATAQQVLEGFPWHTSFDVMMVPEEMARNANLPALT